MNHDPGRVAVIPPGRCLHNWRVLTPAWAVGQTIPLWFSPKNGHQTESPQAGSHAASSFQADLPMPPGAEARVDTRTEIATGNYPSPGSLGGLALLPRWKRPRKAFFQELGAEPAQSAKATARELQPHSRKTSAYTSRVELTPF